MGRVGPTRTLHRRQAEASRHQQARQQLSAKTICSGRACGSEVQRQAVFWPEALAGRTVIAQPLQHRRRGTGQQAGTHGMGRTGQRGCLQATCTGWHDRPADDGCLATALEIALRFPHPQTSDDCEFRNLPGLQANNEMAQRSNPALPKPEPGRSPLRLSN